MGIAYNTSIVRDGLVLHLDAANPKSYPGSGTTWGDLSGNGNNGTMLNNATFSNGAILFDGVDDYVNLPVNFHNDNTAPFTASIWISTLQYGTVFSQQNQSNPGTATGWVPAILITSEGKVRFEPFWTGSTSNYILSNGTYNDGSYHNIVGTFSGSEAKLYIDGIYQGNKVSLTGNNYSSTFYYFLGGGKLTTSRDPLPDQFINANITSFSFYSRVLQEAEIKQNFEALRGRYGI